MDAILFDFDGVIVDSEPIHFTCLRDVLGTIGLDLGEADYYARYLGYDDHDCFRAAAREAGRNLSERQIAELAAAKTHLVQRQFATAIQPLPGAVGLIRSAAAAAIPVAICSGALREEIELAGRAVGVLDCLGAIVAAGDVPRGKPDPAGYLEALRRLSASAARPLQPARSLVVEDSPAGILAGRAAGMKVLAVANSHPPHRLAAADRVVGSLAELALDDLRALTG